MTTYLPENPALNRLAGTAEGGFPIVAGILSGVFAAIGIGVIVSGARTMQPVSPAPMEEDMCLKPGRPIPMGALTYTPQERSAVFRPSWLWFLIGLGSCGLFTVVTGGMTLLIAAGSLDVMFGWNPLKLTSNSAPTPRLFGVVILGISLVPGLFFIVMGAAFVNLLRFGCFPTVFDCAEGVFRRGGWVVCRLSNISEVRLRRVMDKNYPGTVKVGLAIALRDGSLHPLDPRFSFQRRLGNGGDDPFTDLGQRREGPQLEALRGAAAHLAAQIGVPLTEFVEWGSCSCAGRNDVCRPPPQWNASIFEHRSRRPPGKKMRHYILISAIRMKPLIA